MINYGIAAFMCVLYFVVAVRHVRREQGLVRNVRAFRRASTAIRANGYSPIEVALDARFSRWRHPDGTELTIEIGESHDW